MRKVFNALFVLVLALLVVGLAVAIGVQLASPLHGMTMTIDGETIDGPVVAALFGGAAAFGTIVVGALVIVLLASIAIVVPALLLLVAFAVLSALAVGLAPIAIPVLLVVGAYVLLSRRAKRRSVAPAAPTTSRSSANA